MRVRASRHGSVCRARGVAQLAAVHGDRRQLHVVRSADGPADHSHLGSSDGQHDGAPVRRESGRRARLLPVPLRRSGRSSHRDRQHSALHDSFAPELLPILLRDQCIGCPQRAAVHRACRVQLLPGTGDRFYLTWPLFLGRPHRNCVQRLRLVSVPTRRLPLGQQVDRVCLERGLHALGGACCDPI